MKSARPGLLGSIANDEKVGIKDIRNTSLLLCIHAFKLAWISVGVMQLEVEKIDGGVMDFSFSSRLIKISRIKEMTIRFISFALLMFLSHPDASYALVLYMCGT